MKISSHNEWDKLESVVVGTATNANWPEQDPVFATNWTTTLFKAVPHPKGPVPKHVIDDANEDLDSLAKVLNSAGVTVYRPDPTNLRKLVSTTTWTSDQMYAYCPRDTHLVVGDTVIEAPMSYRARQFESELLHEIRREAIRDGANWIAAPRPMLGDEHTKAYDDPIVIPELDPVFDAANCIRLNDDILYLRSLTGNALGAKWLARALPNKRIHELTDVYAYAHIDSTIIPVREGLVLLNASRVGDHNLPKVFESWDKIWFDAPVKQQFFQYPYASPWIGMNMLMLDPNTAIVEETQIGLIQQLEDRRIEVWAMPMRHARTLGGGFHCVTLDLERA